MTTTPNNDALRDGLRRLVSDDETEFTEPEAPGSIRKGVRSSAGDALETTTTSDKALSPAGSKRLAIIIAGVLLAAVSALIVITVWCPDRDVAPPPTTPPPTTPPPTTPPTTTPPKGSLGLTFNPTMSVPAGDGSLILLDERGNKVYRVTAQGNLSLLAGTGTRGFSGDGGPAITAELLLPQAVAIGPNGDIYIADSGNNRVRRIDSSGIIMTVAGMAGPRGYSGDGGSASSARLSNPDSLAFDRDGNLYIHETYNRRVRRVDARGIISTFAGSGSTEQGAGGLSGDGGPATSAQFRGGGGIAFGPDGSLYIADEFNCRVRRVDSVGTISTVAGSGPTDECPAAGDGGQATQAVLSGPSSVAVTPDGTLYIGSVLGDVRQVRPNGVISTVVGTAQGTLSQDRAGAVYITVKDHIDRVNQGGSLTRVAQFH